MLTKNGNYLIVNRLCALSLSLSLPVSLSSSASLSSSTPSDVIHSPGCDRDTHRTFIASGSGWRTEGKRRCAVSRAGKGGKGRTETRERRMGLGYSADSRATVHTPKRVFVRFHFTPNYLVYTRARTYAEGERGKRRRKKENERERERIEGTSWCNESTATV